MPEGSIEEATRKTARLRLRQANELSEAVMAICDHKNRTQHLVAAITNKSSRKPSLGSVFGATSRLGVRTRFRWSNRPR